VEEPFDVDYTSERKMMRSIILILAALGLLAGPASSQKSDDPRKQEYLNKLNTMRLDVDFKNQPLEDSLDFIREFSGLNIVVDGKVTESFSEDQLKVTMKVRDLLLKSILKLMLGPRGLTATYRDGVILIVPKSEVDRVVHLQIYDVRDLLFKIRDFPGPTVELVSPRNAAAGGPLTGAMFTLDEPHSVITEDFLTEMVRTCTGDNTWDENPNASITLANGRLIISQSRRIHGEIEQFINKLRQFK
jgi:hypothetical protein